VILTPMRRFSVALCFLVAACGAASPPQYQTTRHTLSDGDIQIRLTGGSGVSIDRLESVMDKEGRRACDGAYLLRDERDETYSTSNKSIARSVLRFEVECVK